MRLLVLEDDPEVCIKGTASKDLTELLKETKLEELSVKLEKALPPED